MYLKKLDKIIDQEINKTITQYKRYRKLKGGDIATNIGELGETAIDALSTKVPIAKDIYKPIKNLVDSFSDAHSNLLDSAKQREQWIDIFKDQDFIPDDDPTIKAQGITHHDQKLYRKIVNYGVGGVQKYVYDADSPFRNYLDNYNPDPWNQGITGFDPNSKGRLHFIHSAILPLTYLHDH